MFVPSSVVLHWKYSIIMLPGVTQVVLWLSFTVSQERKLKNSVKYLCIGCIRKKVSKDNFPRKNETSVKCWTFIISYTPVLMKTWLKIQYTWIGFRLSMIHVANRSKIFEVSALSCHSVVHALDAVTASRNFTTRRQPPRKFIFFGRLFRAIRKLNDQFI